MWYFIWILGLFLASSFAILTLISFEKHEENNDGQSQSH